MQFKLYGFRALAVAFLAALLGACATTDEPVSDTTDTTSTVSEDTTGGPGAVDTTEVDEQEMMDPYGPATQSGLVDFVGRDRVFFAFDSSDLSSEARNTLQRQAEWLEHHGNVDVVIEGHCDERGTREYNLALGERRANSVKNYLMALGVSESRLETISYGKERPAVVGRTEEAFSLNRRGVLKVQ